MFQQIFTVARTRYSADEVYERIAALKVRPVQIETTPKPFHYDPNEPLHLREEVIQKKARE